MRQRTTTETITERPLVSFGREICGVLDAGLRREWLVTNGLGGYASGTLAGVNTRRYHGLLVAALAPPVERTVLVGGAVEWAEYGGVRYPLAAHEYEGGTIDPHGYVHLQSFALHGTLPVWTFALGDALLERRVWMAYGANTTYVTYRLLGAASPVNLEITPLVTYRDFHSLTSGRGWQPVVEARPDGACIRAFAGARQFRLLAEGGRFSPGGGWWWDFRYREEAARGLDEHGDLYAPGAFHAALAPGATLALIYTAEDDDPLPAGRARDETKRRQRELLERAGARDADPVVQQLTLAADQFLVSRQSPPPSGATGRAPTAMDGAMESAPSGAGVGASGGRPPRAGDEDSRTIIAGYHWFNDWGRDTMIALPGLTLATGRAADAAGILRGFARYVDRGLLPNNFPDQAGVIPGYNTVDATLWYLVAIHTYVRATGDAALARELLPVLRDIVEWHVRDTRYGIGVDPADGLLRAGEPGVQLTWMDAKVGDLVVTPRIGKPVEINALWYNALRILADFCDAEGDREATARYEEMAGKALGSFRARFLRAEHPHLADVVDGPDGDDWTLRPNQIFAVSLPFPLLEGEDAARVVRAVGQRLFTTYGLRSLSPDDPAYRGAYGGDQFMRDTSYHQGPVWTWLMGAYAEAYARVHGDSAALALLRPFEHHLCDAGLGSVSEILEGDPPHTPRGCIAQAWGVAEVLHVWRELEGRIAAGARSDAAARPIATTVAGERAD